MSSSTDLLDDEAITSLNDELHDILDEMHESGLQDCSKESIRVRHSRRLNRTDRLLPLIPRICRSFWPLASGMRPKRNVS